MQRDTKKRLWFDVGIKRYTTEVKKATMAEELWFDVGIKRYTTEDKGSYSSDLLWFDVGIKRYTTTIIQCPPSGRCGLM